MDKSLAELVKISKFIGKDPFLVQGAGGNISIKDESGLMYIKSSGSFLKDMDGRNGFVLLPFRQIHDFFNSIKFQKNSSVLENKIQLFIENLVMGNDRKPSMEVSMHAFLDKYVIHTHPLYLNVVLCLKDAKKMIAEIFHGMDGEIVWINYVNPGYSLGYKIFKTVKKFRNKDDTKIIFLENHGLIVSGSKLESVMKLSNKINQQAKRWLVKNKIMNINHIFDQPQLKFSSGVKQVFFSKNPIILRYGKNLTKLKKILKIVMFPDFAVYCLDNFKFLDSQDKKDLGNMIPRLNHRKNPEIIFIQNLGVAYIATQKRAQALHEILLSHLFIYDSITNGNNNNNNNNNKPKTLKNSDIKYIKNMRMEKHRIKQLN